MSPAPSHGSTSPELAAVSGRSDKAGIRDGARPKNSRGCRWNNLDKLNRDANTSSVRSRFPPPDGAQGFRLGSRAMWQPDAQTVAVWPESARMGLGLHRTAAERTDSAVGPVVRFCHVALALYLLPAVVLVLGLGAVLLVATESARLLGRVSSR